RYRAKPFLDEEFHGVRKFQKDLVDILRKAGSLSNEEILSRLGIEPSEHEAIRAISIQLDILNSYGLVTSTARGWKWTG
ncbi:MAG: hypothetical protein JSV20_06625, partial [Candidatus Bathyarchaeota archaeon]